MYLKRAEMKAGIFDRNTKHHISQSTEVVRNMSSFQVSIKSIADELQSCKWSLDIFSYYVRIQSHGTKKTQEKEARSIEQFEYFHEISY